MKMEYNVFFCVILVEMEIGKKNSINSIFFMLLFHWPFSFLIIYFGILSDEFNHFIYSVIPSGICIFFNLFACFKWNFFFLYLCLCLMTCYGMRDSDSIIMMSRQHWTRNIMMIVTKDDDDDKHQIQYQHIAK